MTTTRFATREEYLRWKHNQATDSTATGDAGCDDF
jgi:hypothetical protein